MILYGHRIVPKLYRILITIIYELIDKYPTESFDSSYTKLLYRNTIIILQLILLLRNYQSSIKILNN